MNQDELDELLNQLKEENDSGEDISTKGQDDKDDDEEKEENMKEDNQEATFEQSNTSSKFRNFYMNKITQAFGSDLDQIRQEPNFNGTRLNILIDSLEAGIDIFSNLEQEIILADEEK
ncbi:ribosome-assembly protein 3-domain-containing protein [Cokeromyces recurvatus]|uniref:ribosome-assembly protein 3-domain-containing protein n=1 Tax=Cokeromyces recurvatus TaxID=90255 RepID=UPI0022203CCD|nr:ribosome-assembly protein 3-domain-containing protein [Cokeromyces recurvatus]KAI7897849.1 ribosome-assembly protein 3-domain-containing protein [Cokeromyces recurvatus]